MQLHSNPKPQSSALPSGPYPFGMVMQGRSFSLQTKYKYGFNTQEKDLELGQDIYTAEFWEYDAKLGRRWNLDPRPIVYASPYSCFLNNPLINTDVSGDTTQIYCQDGDLNETINDAGPLKRIMVNNAEYENFRQQYISNNGGTVDFNNQTTASDFMDKVTTYLKEKETDGGDYFAETTGGMRMSFDGSARDVDNQTGIQKDGASSCPNDNVTRQKGEGRVNVYFMFDNGKEGNLSYRAVSGAGGNGCLANGDWAVTVRLPGRWQSNSDAFSRCNEDCTKFFSFKFSLTRTDNFRPDILIHPTVGGTLGCIGILSDTEYQIEFNRILMTYFKQNPKTPLKMSVNLTNNKNVLTQLGCN